MLLRIIFILFTLAFITYTWLHADKVNSKVINDSDISYNEQGNSQNAVNDVKGSCLCEASWTCKDKEGNEDIHEATENKLLSENKCLALKDSFCNDTCPDGQNEDEKNAICPGRSSRFAQCSKHRCDCNWKDTIN